jgi:hypothetical protein
MKVLFGSPAHAGEVLTLWKGDNNTIGPHGGLGNPGGLHQAQPPSRKQFGRRSVSKFNNLSFPAALRLG